MFCFVYLYLFTFNGVLIPTEVYLSQYISRSKDCYWFQQLYVFTKLKYKDLQRENILKICMYTFDKKKDSRNSTKASFQISNWYVPQTRFMRRSEFVLVLQKIPFTYNRSIIQRLSNPNSQ